MILTLFVTTIKYFLAALVMVGFVYFILLRAISTKNYKRKALYADTSVLYLLTLYIVFYFYFLLGD